MLCNARLRYGDQRWIQVQLALTSSGPKEKHADQMFLVRIDLPGKRADRSEMATVAHVREASTRVTGMEGVSLADAWSRVLPCLPLLKGAAI